MRLIDADKIEYEWKANDNLIAFKDDIDKIPTINTNIVFGHWANIVHINGYAHGTCSVCKKIRVIDNFCSNCGAKMDEVEE